MSKPKSEVPSKQADLAEHATAIRALGKRVVGDSNDNGDKTKH
jgi:hypothetical protein